MSLQKSKKNFTQWVQCDECFSFVTNNNAEKHVNDCPPSKNSPCHFIKDEILHGSIDVKTNEDIKGVIDNGSLVFLSQTAIQLCSLAIGEWAKVQFDTLPPVVKVVWPTTEKSLTSVLMTKHALELAGFEMGSKVLVSKLADDIVTAHEVKVVILNAPKSLECTSDLLNRIYQANTDRVYCVGNKLSIMYFGKILKLEVKAIVPEANFDIEKSLERLSLDENGFARITEATSWKLFNVGEFEESIVSNSVSDIGGLEREISEIRESINACLHKMNKQYGLQQSKSVLLRGNPGTGKTLLAKSLAKESGAFLVSVCASELFSKYSGKIEEAIKHLFEEAVRHAPSIILLDEVDVLCTTRTQRMTDSEKRISSTLLTAMDELNQIRSNRVFIIGTTNKIDSIDPVFRRYGRFDREIEISTPTPASRKDIIFKLLKNAVHSLTDVEFREISLSTHGFVGADLVSLCSRAGLNAAKRKADAISIDDFKVALKDVRPSAMREVQVEVANVRWSDIGGQDSLKLILKQAVEWPLRHPESFLRLGITPPKGVLMFGPPGCSKTMIAKALATESGLNFLSIKGPELFSKWVGESEKAVRDVFRKARQVSPSIIFFDEIDALGGERSAGSSTSVQERVLAQLLTELDGVSPLGDVTVLAATNRPDRIDKALLRPGRLDRIVYVPLPDNNTRREIFKIKFGKMPVENVDLEELITATEGYSGAEVNAVCHEAAMMALEESIEATVVEKRHFDKALKLIVPRTPLSLLQLYQNYLNKEV